MAYHHLHPKTQANRTANIWNIENTLSEIKTKACTELAKLKHLKAQSSRLSLLMTPTRSSGIPKITLRFNYSLQGDSKNSLKVIMLTVTVYNEKAMQSSDCISLPASLCDNTCRILATKAAFLSFCVQSFYWGYRVMTD